MYIPGSWSWLLAYAPVLSFDFFALVRHAADKEYGFGNASGPTQNAVTFPFATILA